MCLILGVTEGSPPSLPRSAMRRSHRITQSGCGRLQVPLRLQGHHRDASVTPPSLPPWNGGQKGGARGSSQRQNSKTQSSGPRTAAAGLGGRAATRGDSPQPPSARWPPRARAAGWRAAPTPGRAGEPPGGTLGRAEPHCHARHNTGTRTAGRNTGPHRKPGPRTSTPGLPLTWDLTPNRPPQQARVPEQDGHTCAPDTLQCPLFSCP